MINFLKGKVISHKATEITLLCGQVGYQVLISPKTSSKLSLNQSTQLFIYTHVREDTLNLYGFLNQADKDIFSLLLSVSGIGPKIALAIEAVASAKQIEKAVLNADVAFLNQIPGIGKKSAQRIIVDLKSKIGASKELNLKEADANQFTSVQAALKSLGFTIKEANEAIAKVKHKNKLSESEIVKQALKNLASPQ